ncbi:MAG: acyl carrier protein [Lachnospiraceae bacterium]|nr:acyl carrier protein [Lachnospiraceae bacterium]MBQ2557799.1 acyl carrier protein [Lachnospiraceae bacterium]
MFEKILEILQNQLSIDVTGVTEDTSFRDDLRIDSLDLYEVVTALEDEYGIEIQPEDLDGITTIGDVVEFLAKRGIE